MISISKNIVRHGLPYTRNLNKSFVILLFLSFSSMLIMAQDKKISIEADNERLRDILDEISANEQIYFSYKASDEVFDQRITYFCDDKALEDAISGLLALAGLQYMQVGNHLVITALKSSVGGNIQPDRDEIGELQTKDQSATAIEPDTVIKTIEKLVYIRDTIRETEVISQTDTVFIRDTVWMEKPASGRNTIKIRDLRNVFRFEPGRDDGWSLAFSYAQMATGFVVLNKNLSDELEQISESEKTSFRNFSLGSRIQFHQKRWTFSAGFFLTGFSHRFNYVHDISEGGFFDVDTLDIFYTVTQNDTAWTYVTDSAWIPLDREVTIYDRFNRIGLLESELSAGYTLYAKNDISFYASAGFRIGVPVWAAGNTISDEPGYPVKELRLSDLQQFTTAYRLALGISYRSGNWANLFAEVFYRRNTSALIENYPLDRRLQAFGLNIGLVYYL